MTFSEDLKCTVNIIIPIHKLNGLKRIFASADITECFFYLSYEFHANMKCKNVIKVSKIIK